MSNLSITKTVILCDGTTLEIKRLSLSDLISLSETIQIEREQIVKKLADEEKLDRYEKLNLINEVRRTPVDINEVIKNSTSPKGAISVIKKALVKSGFDTVIQERVLEEIDILDLIVLSKNLVLDVKDEKEKKGPNESPLVVSQ